MINVEVAYKQTVVSFLIPNDSNVLHAIEQSGFLLKFPEINLMKNTVGVFSKQVKLDYILSQGDRVEIYRPLLIDPKDARRTRANKAKKSNPLSQK